MLGEVPATVTSQWSLLCHPIQQARSLFWTPSAFVACTCFSLSALSPVALGWGGQVGSASSGVPGTGVLIPFLLTTCELNGQTLAQWDQDKPKTHQMAFLPLTNLFLPTLISTPKLHHLAKDDSVGQEVPISWTDRDAPVMGRSLIRNRGQSVFDPQGRYLSKPQPECWSNRGWNETGRWSCISCVRGENVSWCHCLDSGGGEKMTTDEGPHRGHHAEKGSLCVMGWRRESPFTGSLAGCRNKKVPVHPWRRAPWL